MDKQAQYDDAKGSDGVYLDINAQRLSVQVGNWKTVLRNYRSHNNVLTAAFTLEDLQFRSMVAMYKKFTFMGGVSEGDLLAAFDGSKIQSEGGGKTISDYVNDIADSVPIPGVAAVAGILKGVTKFVKPEASKKLYMKAFGVFQDTCRNVVPGHRNIYVVSICSDFDPGHWDTVYQLLTDHCDMPGSPIENLKDAEIVLRKSGFRRLDGNDTSGGRQLIEYAGVQNPLRNSQLFQSMCTRSDVLDKATDANKKSGFPGGVQGSLSDQGVFDFLKDPKVKYLTFFSGAPIAIAWTGVVSDSRSFSASLAEAFSSSTAKNFDMGMEVGLGVTAALNLGFSGVDGKTSSFEIGKTGETSHEYERTVSFVLDDEDAGIKFQSRSFSKLV